MVGYKLKLLFYRAAMVFNVVTILVGLAALRYNELDWLFFILIGLSAFFVVGYFVFFFISVLRNERDPKDI